MNLLKRSQGFALVSLTILVVLLLSLHWTLADTSSPIEEWGMTFGGSENDFGESIQETSDGGYIITGTTDSFGAGGYDVYLVKTDHRGVEEWSMTFGSSDHDFGVSVQEASDGGYIVAGTTDSFGAGGFDVYLVKTDHQGVEEWSTTFGSSDHDYGRSVQVTSDGGYIIAGETWSFGAGGSDVYLVKVDSQGVEEWNTTFGGSSMDEGYSVQVTSDRGYIITGSTDSFGAGGYDVYLVKTDHQGVEEWSTTFGSSDHDWGRSVQVTSDGGYIITGYTGFYVAGGSDVYLVKVDSQGREEWSTTFGGYSTDEGSSVQVTSDGGYIMAGWTSSFDAGGSDVYLVKVDSQGVEEWGRTFGGSENDYGWSVQVTSDGGYIIAGTTGSSGAGGSDVYLVKVDSPGEEEETYFASVVDLEALSEVNVGEVFTVEVTVSYEFTVPTEMRPGIYDVEAETWLAEEFEILVGMGTRTYSFELTAPEEEGTWSLEADVWYNLEGEWTQRDEGSWNAFEVSVVEEENGGGGGIPGFPYLSIAFGLIIVLLLRDRLHI